MKGYLGGIVLGLIQGLTEFLPVSSSGHLALAEKVGIGEENLFLNLTMHLATLFSVVIVMRKPLLDVIKHPTSNRTKFLLLASVPTAFIAGLIRYLLPDTTDFLPLFFMVTAAILLLPRIIFGREPIPKANYYDNWIKNAFIVGAAQGVACFNGISRSGSTVVAMNLTGQYGKECAENSFLLSIPIILGSAAVEFLTGGAKTVDIPMLIAAGITSFLTGIVAIKVFLKVLKNNKIQIFSIYAFVMSIASFLILYL